MTSHSEGTTVSSETDLHQRYDNLMQRVAAAAQRSGRRPQDIIVVLVSKYGTLEQIRELTRLGHRHFRRVSCAATRTALSASERVAATDARGG